MKKKEAVTKRKTGKGGMELNERSMVQSGQVHNECEGKKLTACEKWEFQKLNGKRKNYAKSDKLSGRHKEQT